MSSDLSKIAAAIGPLYAEIESADRPILVAFVERSVGSVYREWASEASSSEARAQLTAAAEREDENAGVLESRAPDAAMRLARLRESHAQLETLVSSALDGLSRPDQMRALAHAERSGGSLYRAFAEETEDPAYRAALLDCESREQDNAETLEALATK
jgi:rubrerythrin